MANFDFEIYDGKSFKDLCKDVVDRSQNKKDQLDILVSDLRSLIKNANDAQAFIPRIKELIEIGVKNDEQIIKLSAVIQRLQSAQVESTGEVTGMLTEADKEQLMQIRMKEVEELKTINKSVKEALPELSMTGSL